jgi:hypothetical protein
MTATRGIWSVGLLCLAALGCQDPPEIVPAAPPGVDLPPPALPPGSEAQAIGEQKIPPAPDSKATSAPAGTTPAPPAEPASQGAARP